MSKIILGIILIVISSCGIVSGCYLIYDALHRKSMGWMDELKVTDCYDWQFPSGEESTVFDKDMVTQLDTIENKIRRQKIKNEKRNANDNR